MSLFRLIFNILWFIMGGLMMGLMWWLVGLLCFISIIGIPFGRSCFVIGELAFWPFGQESINRRHLNRAGDIGTSGFGTLGNIIWFIFAGFWLALAHLFYAICSIITIIGIPFGLQHIKLAALAVAPIGQTIVTKR